MTSLNAITVPTTSDAVATCDESSPRSHFVDKTHNFKNIIVRLHCFDCSQERNIFFPSSLTGDIQFAKTSNAAASLWGCYCSPQYASLQYVQNKLSFIGQGICAFVFQLNFFMPLPLGHNNVK